MNRRRFLITGLATLFAAKVGVSIKEAVAAIPYKGRQVIDAGLFYCPYVPLQLHIEKVVVKERPRKLEGTWTCSIEDQVVPIKFKTRYDMKGK